AAEPNTRPPLRPGPVALAGLCGVGAAAWMVGGLLREPMLARGMGLLGVAIGTLLVWLPLKRLAPAFVQYLPVPVAAVVGAVLVAPAATGGAANLPNLVLEVVKGGGLRQTPIPFDPGWRFILVVFFALLGSAATALPAGLRRPRLAVAIPLPIAVAAGFIQPPSAAATSSIVAILLLMVGLTFAYGSDLAANGVVDGRFEARRMAKGLGMLVLLSVVLVVLGQAGVLFPNRPRNQVIPPQRPPPPQLQSDRELFKVTGGGGPWRVGTLEVYDGAYWLLPAQDPKAVRKVQADAVIAPANRPTKQVQFDITDLAGRALPAPAGLVSITGAHRAVELDTLTGVPRLPSRLPRGLHYTAVVTAPPTGREMADAPAARVRPEYTFVPPAPNAVAAMLAGAPANPFDRLQYVRSKLYETVVAAGAGTPTRITPARVDAMLHHGTTATPYEITAAEALLARWAGVPSRIGFGFHGGEPAGGGVSVHPRNGAAWLEVYFEGYGWIPFVGTPPQAKASLSKSQKNLDPSVRSSDELALTVYIAVKRPTIRLLFEVVRYWLLLSLPFILLAIALVGGYPYAFKAVRRRRREKWARRWGPGNRVLVAYADFRDRCFDLNLGDVRATPLAYLAALERDDEHKELAWLVTRCLWGDLADDVRDGDAEAAETLTASLLRRVVAEQTFVNRLLGAVSRASLRDPYSDDVPNFWPRLRLRLRRRPSDGMDRRRRSLWARSVGGLNPAAGVIMALLLGSCASAPAQAQERLNPPPRLVPPDGVLGYSVQPEPKADREFGEAGSSSLMSTGRVFTVREGTIIQGSVQVSMFKPDVDTRQVGVRAKVLSELGGTFHIVKVGPVRLLTANRPEQQVYVWFPPERNVMYLFIYRKAFTAIQPVTRAMVAYVRGWPIDEVVGRGLPPGTVPGPTGPEAGR
ncbi:MAG: hypothetical protein QOK43_249, partial [Acidimicrobiaceae bacterium]|nr:hypothetical protein [Acidimicrobiaceae bacterium]